MIGKPLLAFLAAPFLASAASDAPIVTTDIPQVRQVDCENWRGTAWRNGVGSFVTAWHVASGEGCTIDGEPIEVTWHDPKLDIAILRTKVYGIPLPIDCNGFQDGDVVLGIGYANGLPVQRVTMVQYDKALDDALPKWNGFTTLVGDRYIPGESGGPAVNVRTHRVGGIVNGYNSEAPLSYSQDLSKTPLCQH